MERGEEVVAVEELALVAAREPLGACSRFCSDLPLLHRFTLASSPPHTVFTNLLTIARLAMDSAGAAGMSGGSWGGASTARGSTLAR